MSLAVELAHWAEDFQPAGTDLELAQRSLVDTVAVAVAARSEPILSRSDGLSEVARWSVAGHVLDFDDLHMESTTHISAVCLPAVLAAGGGAREYLAAAGVMARLGTGLGWAHYSAGWHATTTAGAPAAAAGAALALGLDADRIAIAMALAVPGAGGVQRAFGTDAKSLQVGFAADAGVRAARLAAAGVTADMAALDAWFELVGGDPTAVPKMAGPAVPGGLAIKVFPCCYALQRPISAVAELVEREGVDLAQVDRIVVRTPKGTVTPLIHHRPVTGLQGKFSLEYAIATALLDDYQGLEAFTDGAVRRPAAQELLRRVDVQLTEGGDWLLAGKVEADVHIGDRVLRAAQQFPPGSPHRPVTQEQLMRKAADCLVGTSLDPETISWSGAPALLRSLLTVGNTERNRPWSS